MIQCRLVSQIFNPFRVGLCFCFLPWALPTAINIDALQASYLLKED